MEAIRKALKFSGLKQSFIIYVLITFLLATTLSCLAIWGCISLQRYILPENEVYVAVTTSEENNGSIFVEIVMMDLEDFLKENTQDNDEYEDSSQSNVSYSIHEEKNTYAMLSFKRKLIYQASKIAMVALPLLFSLFAILLCGYVYYRRKLKQPITLLTMAAQRIANEDLDFNIVYDQEDEMGQLCTSFEHMRVMLKENNQNLWKALEDRKQLQQSVAHDIRNPIAIMQGYAQYLQLQLTNANPSKEKMMTIVENILQTSKRLERYTDSLRTISRLEEFVLQPQLIEFSSLFLTLQKDLALLTQHTNIQLLWENHVTQNQLYLDSKVLYRILENLISNAIRYAKTTITIQCSTKNSQLFTVVTDDGIGFNERILHAQQQHFHIDTQDENHTGMGLTICQVLCRKHNGYLQLTNNTHGGAKITFVLSS